MPAKAAAARARSRSTRRLPKCWPTPRRIEGLHQAASQGHAACSPSFSPGDLNRDIMVAIAIARGIGERPLLGGMTWGFGDDWIWQFRKVDDRIQIVRRNVRFRAAKRHPAGEGRPSGLHRQHPVQPADRHDQPERRLRGRSDAGVHERPAADLQRAARLHRWPRTGRAGRRSRASRTTSRSKWRPPTPPAARRRSTPCPTAAA